MIDVPATFPAARLGGAPDSVPLEVWRLSPSGELRFSLDTFQGARRLNLRRWMKRGDGPWIPTRKGITIPEERLSEFARILAHAERVLAAERAS